MTSEIDGGVLALAVRVIGRCAHDASPGCGRTLVMTIGVADTHEHREPLGLGRTTVGRDDGPVSEDELHAMRPNAEAHSEAERAAQPVACLDGVVIGEDWDDRGRRNGAVLDHPPFPTRTSCNTQLLPSGSVKSANDA